MTLTDVDSGQTYTTTTDDNGDYCFEGLEPGDYKVMFQDESEIDPDYVDVFDGSNWVRVFSLGLDDCGHYIQAPCAGGFPHAFIDISVSNTDLAVL